METDKKVQILLSTYNGEKYLREQLDSFINQTCFSQIRVLIRDDGSTDGTVDILREYAEKYGFELICGENIGGNASYGALIQASDPECAYFAISDQDDVWLPDKIEIALACLEKNSSNEPALFFSLTNIVDEELNPISKSYMPTRGASFYNAMVQNVCIGHTQVFNAALRELVTQTDCANAHVVDWWIYLIASGLGKVFFEPQATVLHRQHGKNAVGYEMNPVKKMIVRLKRVRSREAASISRQLISFMHYYGNLLPEDYRREAKTFLEAQKSFKQRFLYLLQAKIYRQSWNETILVRLLYLIGKYVEKGE